MTLNYTSNIYDALYANNDINGSMQLVHDKSIFLFLWPYVLMYPLNTSYKHSLDMDSFNCHYTLNINYNSCAFSILL